MCTQWERMGRFGVTVACCWLVGMTHSAQAVEELSGPALQPAETSVVVPAEPAEPKAPTAVEKSTRARETAFQEAETLPDEAVIQPQASSGADCCPTPPIDYRTHRKARRMYRCSPGTVQMVMMVDDPADCLDCLFEVPLCVPVCCEGEPVVCSRTGIFGRGVVEYCWACGFKAKVVFKHKACKITVHYHG